MQESIKARIHKIFNENIMKRKAMFIPIFGVAAFMLVGYAAVDREAPEILTDKLELPYGEQFDADLLSITDNTNSKEELTIDVNDQSLDTKQLGTYQVEVSATDQFSNTTTKTIEVDVVDLEAPVIEKHGVEDGYVIEVPVNGSGDITSYLKATDNVDGDVTPFMSSDVTLDPTRQGEQIVHVSVSDTAGNETNEEFIFLVADFEAPTMTLKSGADVVVDYKSTFDVNNYIVVTDNFDQEVDVKTDVTVDTSTLDNVQKVKVTAKDAAGNTSEQVLNVTVKDISGPKIELTQTEIRAVKDSNINLASYIQSAEDNTDGDMKSKVTYNAIDMSTTGTKVVTYTATDTAGNTSTAELKVNVEFSGQVIVNTGLTKLGTPYVWGATGPTAFDCSGFTQWVYRQNGISIPRTSGDQKAAGRTIPMSEIQPGDILWRSGHVGIYIGNGQYVHAPHTGDVVKVSSLSSSTFTCGVRYR